MMQKNDGSMRYNLQNASEAFDRIFLWGGGRGTCRPIVKNN